MDERNDPGGGFNPPVVVNIVGELVALGPRRREFVPLTQRWNNDFAAMRSLGEFAYPQTLEQAQMSYDQTAAPGDTRFLIYERATWRPIGITRLFEVDWYHRNAMYAVSIGEPDCRGRGYGTETTRLMLDYAFTALGLHGVMLTVFAFNEGGLRAYERAGFRQIGRRREAVSVGGRFWDVVYMDCLASEFTSPVLAPMFEPKPPRQQ
ncbi:MAG: hypothetical protein NVS4B8_19420 [Herpetosiphon sp.]